MACIMVKNSIYFFYITLTSNIIILDRFDQFWAVNRKLMNNENDMKHVPYKLYMDNKCPVQRLQRTHNDDGQLLNLDELLRNHIENFEGSKKLISIF